MSTTTTKPTLDQSGTIRRTAAAAPQPSMPTISRSAPTISRALALDEMTTTPTPTRASGPSEYSIENEPMTKEQFATLLRENFDLVVELLEDRIINDLDRRGGRYGSDF